MNDKMKKDAGGSDPGSSRREFLRRALRTGVYVAPVMVAMSMRNLSAAQASAVMGVMP